MFPAVKNELMHIIQKAVGLTHNSRALSEAQTQILKVRKVITELIDASNIQVQQLDERFRQEKLQLQQRLEQEWGEQSAKNRKVAEEISAICNNVVTNKVSQMFRPTGSIRAFYQSKIDSLTDMQQVERLCKEMPSSLVNDIASQWESIMKEAKETVSGMLQDKLSSIEDITYGEICSENAVVKVRKLTPDEKIANYRNQYFTGVFISTIAVMACPPLAPIVAVGAAIWSFFRGKKKNDEQILQQNKNNLTRQLGLMLDEINQKLTCVQPGNVRSIVNEFIYQLKRTAEKAIAEEVSAQKQKIHQQLINMENQAIKPIEDKQRESQSLNNALNAWQALNTKTKELMELYFQLESSLC